MCPAAGRTASEDRTCRNACLPGRRGEGCCSRGEQPACSGICSCGGGENTAPRLPVNGNAKEAFCGGLFSCGGQAENYRV